VAKRAGELTLDVPVANEPNVPLDPWAMRGELAVEHRLGLRLRHEQQKRERRVVDADIEYARTHLPRAGVDAQLYSRVAARQQLIGEPQAAQHLEGARLYRQGAGLMQPIVCQVDDADHRAKPAQLRRQRQPGRPSTDHEHVASAIG
jgi:hypothetical protein